MEDAIAEVEAVCSIWDDVKVEKNSDELIIVRHKLRSLENEKTSANIMIECRISNGYPVVNPDVKLSNPRGITDADFDELSILVENVINSNDSMPIICEIFQTCCDFLTEKQHSADLKCGICLDALCTSPIIVTACDHFLHSDCYTEHLKHCAESIRKELDEAQSHMKDKVDKHFYCPVCRFILTDGHDYENEVKELYNEAKTNRKTLNARRRSSLSIEDIEKNIAAWRRKQKQLSRIFEKQKKKGGIIDLEEEKKRGFFIEVTSSAVTGSNE